MTDLNKTIDEAVYPVKFLAQRRGFRWWAVSIGADGIVRNEIGPFWRPVPVMRAAQRLTNNFRTGRDIGCAAGKRCAPDSSKFLMLTKAEIQSKQDRVQWAEGLIMQLPEDHDGRNSWLPNYGVREEAVAHQKKRGLSFDPQTRVAQ